MVKWLMLLAIFITSCATPTKKRAESELGQFFGRMKVIMDDVDVTELCYFEAMGSHNEKQKIYLPKSGLFQAKTTIGDVSIVRLSCTRGLSNHYYNFKKEETLTFSNSKGEAIYIGDSTIHWQSGDFNPAWLILSVTTLAWIGTEARDIKVSQQNRQSATLSDFKEQLGIKIRKVANGPLRIPAGKLHIEKKVAKKSP